MNDNGQMALVFEQLERCHTAMADFFPHTGLLEIGGSKTMLGTRLMPVLQDCASHVRESLSRLHETRPNIVCAKLDLLELWSSVLRLLERLRKADSKRDVAEVNDAARLLYLASGTTWNYLRGLLAGDPPHNPQYVRVESMLPLLQRCGRESKAETDGDPKQLAQRLAAELDACLR